MKRNRIVMSFGAVVCAVMLFAAPAISTGADPAALAVDETLDRPAPTGVPEMIGGPDAFAVPAAFGILDDFNRADGPIGPDWTVHDGWCNVSGNAAVCGSQGRATFNNAPGDGNTADADISAVGTALQFTGLLLNYGAGASNLFLKVQQQEPYLGEFTNAACYTGNNSGSFGLGFFGLDAPFSTAHMRATRVGTDVTIEFTNIDGGTQPNQTYVCSGAPAPEGNGVGILGYAGIARLDNFAIGVACDNDTDCDDGLFCTGVETCDNGTCVASGDPCHGETPVCDEDSAACVECLNDDNCNEGQFCEEGVCRFPCELSIRYREIRADRLTRPRRVILNVTSTDEVFDIFGRIDPGVFTWQRVKFNRSRNRLTIRAIVPAGLEPGSYPISVGECSGEVVITGNDR